MMRPIVKGFFRNIFFPLLILLLCAPFAMAQTDAQLAQYWAMPTYYNPAKTGATDYLRIRGAARLQWLGIQNAPRDFIASADMPLKLGKKHRLGIGALFDSESLGLYENLSVGLQASYKFQALKGAWSVGVQGAYVNTKFKGSKIYVPEGDDFHEPNDPDLPTQDVSGNAFDLAAGVSYSHKYFSIGASVRHIMEPTLTMDSEGGSDSEVVQFTTTLPRQAYFIADGNIPVKNSLISLQPSMLVRTDFNSFSAELTMRASYNRFISFGLGYRYKDALCAMLGAEFKNFFIGYAYEYPMSAISKASSGSHEFVAGYSLKLNFGEKNKNKHRSIRLM